jgi:hypothetical protein
MMRATGVLLLLAAMLPGRAWAQDSVRYSPDYRFREGIYLDFAAFRHNAPSIPMAALTTAQGRPVQDLRSEGGKLFHPDSSGQRVRLDFDRVWGFCANGVVYVHAGNGFSRIGLMGALAHLTFDATYHDLDPYSVNGTATYTVEEQRFLDMATGQFLPVTAGGIYRAIARDAVLKEAFDALRKKDRNRPETLFLFMRRYNDRHPLYFPR